MKRINTADELAACFLGVFERMNELNGNRFVSVVFAVSLALGSVWMCERSLAQGSAGNDDSTKIKPYTGPPIYLDEPEQVASPTIVTRETKKENYQDSGKVRVEREVALYSDNHFEADGIYREYYPSGQLFVEGNYRKGRQEGEWTFYFENGKLNRKADYKNGKPDGPREIFRGDGTLAAKRNFRDGLRDGEWITYDKTGKKPVAEELYDNGKPDGVWKAWHPNGQLRQEANFKQGQRHGTTTEWNEKGEKRGETNFAEGKLHGTATRWFPDGRKISQQYNDGKLESQSQE